MRVWCQGTLGTARVSRQIAVGFGGAVVPTPTTTDYPTIRDLPAPRLRGCTRESVVAEKLHAMVRRGLLNSRMRDFLDVWALSRQFESDGRILAAAIGKSTSARLERAPDHDELPSTSAAAHATTRPASSTARACSSCVTSSSVPG